MAISSGQTSVRGLVPVVKQGAPTLQQAVGGSIPPPAKSTATPAPPPPTPTKPPSTAPPPVAAPLPNNPTTNPVGASGTITDNGLLQCYGSDCGGLSSIFPGGVASESGGGGSGTAGDTPITTPNEQVGNPSGPQAGLSFAQVENYWIQAGGNAQAASMAAAVADAESGLNAAAQRTNPDGTSSIGLWLIPANGTPPGSTDPLANARAAVQLSQNGTDWTQWCSTWSDNNCGENGGTYLGQGANALMSLAGQKPGASYNVFGSTPSGSGVGASSATSGTPGTSSTTSSKSSLLIFGAIIVIVVVILYLARRKQSERTSVTTEVTPTDE